MKNKGFSLVELIVVIAIMAILVGVAVPVYSSYIEKTQKTKDEQLVDEIKHAIEIAAVGESWYQQMPNGGVAVIVIDAQGTSVKASNVAGAGDLSALVTNALKNTFGEGYADMCLSYDGWTGTLSNGGATLIGSSSYSNDVSGLLGQVQRVTSAFADLIEDGSDILEGDDEGESSANSYLKDTLNIDTTNATQVANGMVLYVANSTLTALGNEGAESALEAAWLASFTDGTKNAALAAYGFSDFDVLAAEYAWCEAFVNFNKTETVDGVSQTLCACSEIKTSYRENASAVSPAQYIKSHATTCTTCNVLWQVYPQTEEAKADAKAYASLMKQISSSKDMVLENIGSEKLYTDSPLVQYVDSYVSAASVLSALGEGANGCVAIAVNVDKTGAVKFDVYPLDY